MNGLSGLRGSCRPFIICPPQLVGRLQVNARWPAFASKPRRRVPKMRRMALAMMFAVGASVALASSAHAVPSFTRQTGLTCNQCHITFSNVPDFTFTGKKFRLNGYRTPYVAEK